MGSLPSSGGSRVKKWLTRLSPALAPTPEMNGQLVPGSKPGPIAAAVSRTLAASWRTLTLPWHLTIAWLSWSSALVIHLFTYLGAPPQGYVAQAKVRELNSIIEHMHTREDLYRKTIRELQEEVDAKDLDKKRALKRLKSTKGELELMQQQVAELQELYRSRAGAAAVAASSSSPHATGTESELNRTALHVTMTALLALVWWFYQQECHAIQRKLVFAVLFPVMWSYVTMLLSHRPVPHPLMLYSAAWGLIGFVGAYKFSQLT